MINQVKVSRAPSDTARWQRILKRLKLWPMSATTLIVAVLVLGASIYLAHTPISHGQPASTANKPAAKKTDNSAVAPSCNGDKQTTALFADCPSFALNFAATQSGPLTDQYFNISNGAPDVNQEAEFYTDNLQNLQIDNGSLQLKAIRQSVQGYSYTSARIDTKGKEDFKYGKLVIRATMPDGIGTWPAIWMLPSNPKYASLSPPTNFYRYLNDGEIDIAEAIGTEPNVVYGIAHSLAYPPDGNNRNYYNTITLPGNEKAYHDYELDWTPTNLTFLVDGHAFFSISKQKGADYRSWPYDQQFYLIINLALGGSWGGRDRAQFPPDGVNSQALPATMKVKSINYYPYVGPR
ncbi:MAG TPA: glycoside hydrolase family 16 protein [Candidatus Saccharimonadales bacterium]|nr:glycoside hydrolase family 16 protein [Candidatus Saccharimonadales bacterium]